MIVCRVPGCNGNCSTGSAVNVFSIPKNDGVINSSRRFSAHFAQECVICTSTYDKKTD